MPARSESATATLLLTQRLVESGTTPLKAAEYWQLASSVADLASLMGRPVATIADQGVDSGLAERIARLFDAATAVAFELERIGQSGISALTVKDDDFPSRLRERLGAAAPPVLYVAGDRSLLQPPALGIVGSRGVDEAGADIASRAARTAVDKSYTVVSGGARGVDQFAMRAAVEADGRTTGVLAEDMLRRLREPETRSAVIEGSVCLCTPYKPTAGFSVANAMGRNKVVYALSDAVLVVASDKDKGGTWAGAIEALRKDVTDVAVWDGPGGGDGNRELIARGGRAVGDVQELFTHAIRRAAKPLRDTTSQLALRLDS